MSDRLSKYNTVKVSVSSHSQRRQAEINSLVKSTIEKVNDDTLIKQSIEHLFTPILTSEEQLFGVLQRDSIVYKLMTKVLKNVSRRALDEFAVSYDEVISDKKVKKTRSGGNGWNLFSSWYSKTYNVPAVSKNGIINKEWEKLSKEEKNKWRIKAKERAGIPVSKHARAKTAYMMFQEEFTHNKEKHPKWVKVWKKHNKNSNSALSEIWSSISKDPSKLEKYQKLADKVSNKK